MSDDRHDGFDPPFRELFELSPDAILVYVGGVVTHANPAALELLRAPSLSDLVGRASRDLIHPESHRVVESNATRLMRGGAETARAEERYVRFDGTLVDVEATSARATFLPGRSFIVFLRDLTERREAEARRRAEEEASAAAAEVREREKWLRSVVDELPTAVFARDADGRFVFANRLCAELFGQRPEEVIGKTVSDFGLSDPAFVGEDQAILTGGEPRTVAERVITDAAGKRRVFQGVKMPIRLGDKLVVLGALNEVTDRKRLEAQLAHSQKMESIGRLAGGVAHDFNNLLTVVLESAEHLSVATPDPEGDLSRIREAASRAASLTRQLLAFARQSPSSPKIVSVDDVVEQMARLLKRVLGEDIALVTELHAPDERVSIDPGQLELVLMNLAVNARDAMPEGGRLVLATRAVDEATVPGAAPVRCLLVEVRDSGVGMDEATLARAFEPFFTTKSPGQGTGLGLSTCYGVVQSVGGRIEVESVVARGTTVRVWLPRCPKDVVVKDNERKSAPPQRGSETVLLLEDDAFVRRATQRMLRSLGYEVIAAGLPEEAIQIAKEHAGRIDALVSDIVMPQMNGVEASKHILALRPGIGVLFVSGYNPETLPADSEGQPLVFLPKPFTRADMADKLRSVIRRAR